jgi:hypothetical protein
MSNIYIIQGDDYTNVVDTVFTEASDVVTTAWLIVKSGKRCHIRASVDGVVGFLNTSGQFIPGKEIVWFNEDKKEEKVTAKVRDERSTVGNRHAIYIHDDIWDIAVKLGKGNASKGIRIALQQSAQSARLPDWMSSK